MQARPTGNWYVIPMAVLPRAQIIYSPVSISHLCNNLSSQEQEARFWTNFRDEIWSSAYPRIISTQCSYALVRIISEARRFMLWNFDNIGFLVGCTFWLSVTCGYSDIAYIEISWNYWIISFRSVITDNLATERFKAEELVRGIASAINPFLRNPGGIWFNPSISNSVDRKNPTIS